MKTAVQKQFYRNGQLRQIVPLRSGKPDGVVRTWHRNGALASEERYRDGVLHGLCRQWDESGALLGEFTMDRGSGVQREWHDNGRVKIEVGTVGGVFCGRNRIWLRDGTLLSERYYLLGKPVSGEEYRLAAKTDPALPRLRGRAGKPLAPGPQREQHIQRAFVRGLLSKPSHVEALAWLRHNGSDRGGRSLGRFRREADAARFIEALYQAGAVEVIVADIYPDKRGNQFSEGLLVKLPVSPARRRAVRRACAPLRAQKLASVQPETDLGERYLYLAMA